MTRIVLFGDETISDSCLPVLAELNIEPVVVFDPTRSAAAEYFNSMEIRTKYEAIPHPDKDHRKEFTEQIRRYNVNFGLIASYSRIIWPELIAAFPYGIANVHGGKLPEYRGANILQWTIINGEKSGGVTLHYIDNHIDSGPIIAMVSIPLTDEDTALTLRQKSIAMVPKLLAENIPSMVKGRVKACMQDESKSAVWPRRKPQDGAIDWSWSDTQIHNLTRALVPPWPPAFYLDADGKRRDINKVMSVEEVSELRRMLKK